MGRSDGELAGDFLSGDRLLVATEVAPLLRVDPKTVTRWAAANRFPDAPDGGPGVIRTAGGHVRFRESVIAGLRNGTLNWKEVAGDGNADG
jgi:hypothetical protein